MKTKHLYMDRTATDTRMFHPLIVEAIKNGGVFNGDFSDIFKLTKAPDFAAVEWFLDFV